MRGDGYMSRWRVLFAVGPGDAVSSYDQWLQGDSKDGGTSLTYTAQTLDFCRDTGVQAWLISSCDRTDIRHDTNITIENRPKPPCAPSSPGYHWQQWLYYKSLAQTARNFRATHLVIDSGSSHWFMWWSLAFSGIKVYLSFHNTYYPIGHWQPTFARNIIRFLDGVFFKWGSDGALGVSDECRKQYVELGGNADRFVVYNALFDQHDFEKFAVRSLGADNKRIAYVGRIEASKGVFDLLAAFELLLSKSPDISVSLDYCGNGSELDDLRIRIKASDLLRGRVTIHGQLARTALLEVYRDCHVVVVPTTSHFMEGFPKVCAEAVLAKRPLVISTAVPTIEGLKEAACIYPCDQPAELMKALLTLLTNSRLYHDKSQNASQIGRNFFDPNKGLNIALQSVMR